MKWTTGLFDMCPFEAKDSAVVWMNCFICDFRKARRKDKEPSTPCPDDPKLYLEEAVLERKLPDIDLRVLVDLPAGLDYNEWLASHSKNAFSVLFNSSFKIWSESAETEFIYIRWIAWYRDVAVALTCPAMFMAHSIASVRTGTVHKANLQCQKFWARCDKIS